MDTAVITSKTLARAELALEAHLAGASRWEIAEAMNLTVRHVARLLKLARRRAGISTAQPRPYEPPPVEATRHPRSDLPRTWVILWPAGPFTPHSQCAHNGTLPSGVPSYCPVCSKCSLDDGHWQLALSEKDQEKVQASQARERARLERHGLAGGRGSAPRPWQMRTGQGHPRGPAGFRFGYGR